jgi:hypothetical protein
VVGSELEEAGKEIGVEGVDEKTEDELSSVIFEGVVA